MKNMCILFHRIEHHPTTLLFFFATARLDFALCRMKDELLSAIELEINTGGKTKGAVIDFSGIEYMDESEFHLFVKIASVFWKRGIIVSGIGLAPAVRSLFELTRFDHVLPCFEGIDEAAAMIEDAPTIEKSADLFSWLRAQEPHKS